MGIVVVKSQTQMGHKRKKFQMGKRVTNFPKLIMSTKPISANLLVQRQKRFFFMSY